ncbi:MAG: TIGR00266 family protein [Chloroflexi bacterium]|nr:MAG: TIGR00266 family protein [Chloroflexota bacterium]
MNYTIAGEIAQYVRLEFEPGDAVWTSKGSLMAYSQQVQWQLRWPGGAAGAVRRSLAGEGLALTYLTTGQPGQFALLAANHPGHLMQWDLADGPIVTTRGAFLAAWGDEIDISVSIARRTGAAFFGGTGLFLQRITGRGVVLIHGSGDFYERQLAAGEQIMVSTGNLAALADSVDYDIQSVGGCRKMFFGGEGFFMTKLTGPGRVLLQTLKRNGSSGGGE